MAFRPSLVRLQERLIARPSAALDQWAAREARPISLRQLTFYGRSLTEDRLLGSANYVRTELPTRLAHRLRDMQTLPYLVLTNPHISRVYELYYTAFDRIRGVSNITSFKENEEFCETVHGTLQEHLAVIPNLVMGMIESQAFMPSTASDKFITSMLRSRISRRVIAEQHLSLTESYKKQAETPKNDYIGEIFLKCDAKAVVERCAAITSDLMRLSYGTECHIPRLHIQGHPHVTFPYILTHLEYIIGEILRNSMQATIEHHHEKGHSVPPIDVLICETDQHVMIRFSDQGGGVPRDLLPDIWSFSQGPNPARKLENLKEVPRMAATLQELQPPSQKQYNSLATLATRPPKLRLGIGMPMSKIYAEYWAGSLLVHNLEGYGLDTFLQISKLGNKNEEITTRATMDAV